VTAEELEQVLHSIYSGKPLPKPFQLITAVAAVRNGASLLEAAKNAGTTAKIVQKIVEAPDLVQALLGTAPEQYEQKAGRVRAIIGQLIIGNLAERVFEEMYRSAVGSTELWLEDDRTSGGDTDYLVRNGQNRQVFRLNIKFHGSQFRRARELVGLDPQDCFALATYKIYSALQKQEKEHLPYIFVVIGVPNLTGPVVGEAIPEDVVEFATRARHAPLVKGKRNIENAVVEAITSRPDDFGLSAALNGFREQISNAEWRVLSARRADSLLRKMLFERAYALRVRGFAMNYRGAELDMHFSVSSDLNLLEDMLRILRDDGVHALSVYLERGTY
jgi:hypothetical protein